MPSRRRPVVTNSLAALLKARGISWSELTRRTLLPPRQLARLRVPTANPRLAVAQRVAAALDVAVEDGWRLVGEETSR